MNVHVMKVLGLMQLTAKKFYVNRPATGKEKVSLEKVGLEKVNK